MIVTTVNPITCNHPAINESTVIKLSKNVSQIKHKDNNQTIAPKNSSKNNPIPYINKSNSNETSLSIIETPKP